MSITFKRTATAAITATLLTSVPAAHALGSSAPVNARDCVEANNVWVYVEYGADSEKSPEGGCATKFSTGFEALESAGFTPKYQDFSFGRALNGIDGVAPVYGETGTYWGYYTGTVATDHTVTYEYAPVGGDETTPAPGSVEAWVVGDGSNSPALTALPEATPESGSSENSSLFAVIAGILAVVGGAVAALYNGLITIPGVVLPKI